MPIDINSLINLGIVLAEGITKVVAAIQASGSLTEAEKTAAIMRIRGQLIQKDIQVQATKL